MRPHTSQLNHREILGTHCIRFEQGIKLEHESSMYTWVANVSLLRQSSIAGSDAMNGLLQEGKGITEQNAWGLTRRVTKEKYLQRPRSDSGAARWSSAVFSGPHDLVSQSYLFELAFSSLQRALHGLRR